MSKACPTCRRVFSYGMACPNDGTVLLNIPELEKDPSEMQRTADAVVTYRAALDASALLSHPKPQRLVRGILVAGLLAAVGLVVWLGLAYAQGIRPTYIGVAIGALVGLAMVYAGNARGVVAAIVSGLLALLAAVAGDALSGAFAAVHNGVSVLHALKTINTTADIQAGDAIYFLLAALVAFGVVISGLIKRVDLPVFEPGSDAMGAPGGPQAP